MASKQKNPLGFHCIGAISRREPLQLFVFDSNLNGPGFRDGYDLFLVPFIRTFPDQHVLHIDNAPSHATTTATTYFEDRRINQYKAPAQSPDLNPVELVWHDLKVFTKEEVKPNTSEQLRNGIFRFGNTNNIIIQ